ncbi:MAG TPA: OmpA family protein, partial [Myxococcota bacterium]
LSDRRAKSVMRYLVDKSVDQARLKAKGFGETQPIASNDTEEGKQANRRVEFRIVPLDDNAAPPAAAPADEAAPAPAPAPAPKKKPAKPKPPEDDLP